MTLVGPAGIGKTRLAIEVASIVERHDGACLVRLEGARNAATVLAAARRSTRRQRAVGDLGDRSPARVGPVARPRQLRAGRGRRRRLRHPPDLRRTVGLRAVHQPAAARTRRRGDLRPRTALARRLGAAVRTTSGRAPILVRHAGRRMAPTVESVCRSLDGLPLAIELAAARTRTMSVDEIGRRLDDRFALLRDPTSRRPDRQRALEAAISWSYELLFPDDQRGLWALGCFADGAPLAGVEHVLAALEVPSESAADVIGRLADRSLVAVEFPVEGGAARYRLLDSIRAFALDRLRDAALDEIALRAQADWLAAVAADASCRTPGPRAGPTPSDLPRGTRQHRGRARVDIRPRSGARPADRDRLRLGLGAPRRRSARFRTGRRPPSPQQRRCPAPRTGYVHCRTSPGSK